MKTEPAAIGGIAAAAINAVVLLVLKHDLDPEVRTAIVTVVTVLAGLAIRTQVSPAVK